ncbi:MULTISPECIES: glycosyltransferase [unclassified Streptomyces]|uniref:glycosyltransferase n=1 Tax=unclassified Streptomyces TaxID=2593676 RepID=UPI001BE691E6|nr:glycosyltransferase [Streptomyces sp. McG3]MBT2900466.1 streptomycin biosynthesis protein StrF [Streptomyces sp. McG3]
MIGYGVCVGPGTLFERTCLPGIERVRAPGSPVFTMRNQRSLFSAYNAMFDQAAANSDVTGLVMLHDDVELRKNPAEVAQSVFEDDSVGMLGSVGGSDTVSLAWWNERETRRGRVTDYDKVHDYGSDRYEVEAVDDVILCVNRWTIENIRFPEGHYRGFEGLGVILATLVRAAGRRVMVQDLQDVMHHNDGRGFNGLKDWRHNELRWHREFFDLSPAERLGNHLERLTIPAVPLRLAARRLAMRVGGRSDEVSDGETGDPVIDRLVGGWYRQCTRLRGRMLV